MSRNAGPRGPYRARRGGLFTDLPPSTVGELVAAVRRRAGMTQAQLADKIAVTRSNLAQMENGLRPIWESVWSRLQRDLPELRAVDRRNVTSQARNHSSIDETLPPSSPVTIRPRGFGARGKRTP